MELQRKQKTKISKIEKSRFQIQQSSKSNSTSKSKIPQKLPPKINLQKRTVFYRYIYN